MRISALVASGAAAMVWAATAARADSPWYVSGSVGGIFLQDYTTETTFSKTVSVLVPSSPIITMVGSNIVVVAQPPTSKLETVTAKGTQRFSYNPGPAENIAIGYRVLPHVRLEGEIGYASLSTRELRPTVNDLYFLNLNGRTFEHQSGAAVDRITWTINAIYEFPTLASRLSPYLGLGYGGNDNHRTSGRFIDADGTRFTSGGGWSGGTEGLLEAGVGVRVSPHWFVSPAYRYDHFFIGGQDASDATISARYSF